MLTVKFILLAILAIVLFGMLAAGIFIFYKIQVKYRLGAKHYNRGLEKVKQGNCQGAIEDLTQALRYNPKLIEAYIERGVCRSRKGDRQGGIEDFTKAIKINSSRSDAYFSRVKVRAEIGEILGAIADYQKANELFLKKENMLDSQQYIKKMPPPETPSQPVIDKEAASSKSVALNSTNESNRSQENTNYHLSNPALRARLIRLLQGDRAAEERLLYQAQIKYPGKSIDWYLEKVIWDLERDRGGG